MMTAFSDVFADVTKQGTKLQTSEYLPSGKYPIIDQGQDDIAGYTDREDGLFTDVPAIIFGDHTRIVKYVDMPFFLGADGVKVLKAEIPDVDCRYLYYAVSAVKIPNTGYNRHFKWLKEAQIPLPDISTQRRIADTLDKVSEGIGLCRRMLGELDLMVKAKFGEMFGDVVQNSKQLPIKTLPEISENLDSRRIPITGSVREKGIYPYYGASGIVDYVKDYLFDEDILLISEDGANLLARSTPIAFSAAGKVWVNNHAHVLRFRDRATQCYVENFLNMIDISNYVTGTAQPKLNQAKLNAIPIPTPELASQKQFMEFTRQIEKIKLTSCEVLDKMETERLALMQEYFG